MINLIKRVHRQALIFLVITATVTTIIVAATAAADWRKFPHSVLIGGLLGLANFKGLAWGLKDFAVLQRPSGKLIFWSMVRFFILALILVVLALLKLINFVGILIGLTVVFALILKEGLREVKQAAEKNSPDEVKQ
jgi:hypothetical protein